MKNKIEITDAEIEAARRKREERDARKQPRSLRAVTAKAWNSFNKRAATRNNKANGGGHETGDECA